MQTSNATNLLPLRSAFESKQRQLFAVRRTRQETEALEITLQKEADALSEQIRLGNPNVIPAQVLYSEMDDVVGFGKEF